MSLTTSACKNGEIIITSGGRLTIENAAKFVSMTREALESSSTVIVEFDPAVEIDITGLQAICSACKSTAASGKTFLFRGSQPPQGLADIIAACGAERHSACKQSTGSRCIWFGGAK